MFSLAYLHHKGRGFTATLGLGPISFHLAYRSNPTQGDALLEVLEQVRPSVKSAGSAALLGLVDAALTTNTTEAQ